MPGAAGCQLSGCGKGAWMGASLRECMSAIEVIALCAGGMGVKAIFLTHSGSTGCRHKLWTIITSTNMFALIRRQSRPTRGGLPVGVFRISVSIASACRAACRPRQAIGLDSCVHDARWHRPACAGSRAVWTKIQTNQPLTKCCAGETDYRRQTAPPIPADHCSAAAHAPGQHCAGGRRFERPAAR